MPSVTQFGFAQVIGAIELALIDVLASAFGFAFASQLVERVVFPRLLPS